MVYTGVWENGDIYYIDTNTSSLDLSLQKLTTVGSELYSLAADSNYLYFTKWNEKLVTSKYLQMHCFSLTNWFISISLM